MTGGRVDVAVDGVEAPPAAFLEAVVEAVAQFVGQPDLRASVLFTNDARIAELHAQFLGDPSPTDVMSFDLDGDAELVDERGNRCARGWPRSAGPITKSRCTSCTALLHLQRFRRHRRRRSCAHARRRARRSLVDRCARAVASTLDANVASRDECVAHRRCGVFLTLVQRTVDCGEQMSGYTRPDMRDVFDAFFAKRSSASRMQTLASMVRRDGAKGEPHDYREASNEATGAAATGRAAAQPQGARQAGRSGRTGEGLLERFRRTRDMRARDQLVERYRGVVENMARSLCLRLPRSVDVSRPRACRDVGASAGARRLRARSQHPFSCVHAVCAFAERCSTNCATWTTCRACFGAGCATSTALDADVAPGSGPRAVAGRACRGGSRSPRPNYSKTTSDLHGGAARCAHRATVAVDP